MCVHVCICMCMYGGYIHGYVWCMYKHVCLCVCVMYVYV